MARHRGRHAAAKNAAGDPASDGRQRPGTGRRPRRRRTLRRGAAAAAVAAVAMAALTASQAPGADFGALAAHRGSPDGGPGGDGSPGDDSYHTELPPLESPAPPERGTPPPDADEAGVPATVLAAYKRAADSLRTSKPKCGLRWELLAAIGKVESGQAGGGAVDTEGTTRQPILGPVLDGRQFAAIKDTDGGALDGDAVWDRAVGPMQFIPSTWNRWAADGNGDGEKDPHNIYDAALAAGGYLCAGDRDLSTQDGVERAVLAYNKSQDYLRTVMAWYEFYRKGVHRVPDGLGVLPTSPGSGGGSGKSSEGLLDGGKGGKGAGGSKGEAGKHGKDGHGGKGGKGRDGSKKPPRDGGSGSHKPGGGGSGGGKSPSPSPTPSDPTPGPGKPSPDKPGPKDPTSAERQGDEEISATAGGEFAEPLRVRVANTAGKALRDVTVRYEIRGLTGARFPGDKKTVTAKTGADGIATAPRISAGDFASLFTVRATVEGGRDVDPVVFRGTVKPKPIIADRLARTTDKALSAAPGAAFADPVEVKATYKGEPVANLPLTARLPADSDKGPYFKDPAKTGEKLHTVTGLKTNDKGVLTLPRLYGDTAKGTYDLTVTTLTGKKVVVPLRVG